MRYRLRTLLIVLTLGFCGCGNFSGGGAFNDTPTAIRRGDTAVIKFRPMVHGAGPPPERSYSDETCFVRCASAGPFSKVPMRRQSKSGEFWIEARIPPEEYGQAEVIHYYLRLKNNGIENRIPASHQFEVSIEPAEQETK